MKIIKRIILLSILFLYCTTYSFSQEIIKPDSFPSSEKKIHSPNKATIYSAIIPGMGQAYNRQYYKIPILYAGFATLLYFYTDNRSEYLKFKEAYAIRKDNLPGTIDPYVNILSDEALLSEKERWRRYRDLNLIGMGLLYMLNVVDATVYAYLFNYDISDNLSLYVEPYLHNQKKEIYSYGVKCVIFVK